MLYCDMLSAYKNFHGNLTTVVRAQNDTSKTANITDTSFTGSAVAVHCVKAHRQSHEKANILTPVKFIPLKF